MDKVLTIAQPQLKLEEPHNCTDAKAQLALFAAFFDALVGYDPQMAYVPSLAASWDVSDDARKWTFKLRPEAAFHNGRSVDAEAVAYSLKRMARPDMGVTLGAPGVYNQYLADMDVKMIDRTSIRLTLREPMADLLDILVTGYILPPEAVEDLGDGFKSAPVGSGPFAFAGYEKGVRVWATKNPAYFSKPTDYDLIQWRLVTDPSERLRMIRQGTADIGSGPPFTADLDDQGVAYVRSRGSTAYILIFNAQSGPLADHRVRLALNLGIDRRALIDTVLNGAGYPLNGFIGPAHFGYDVQAPPIDCDRMRARSLLREAGFGGGLSLTLDSPTAMPDEAVRLSEALQDQLALIDVGIDIVYTEDREHYANKVRRKEIHDMCVFDSSPLSTFRVIKEKIDARFKGSWWQGYHNEVVEKLLDTAQATTDTARREALYRQCFRELNQDPPWLYLYNAMHVTCLSASLSGWQAPAHGIIDPRYIGG